MLLFIITILLLSICKLPEGVIPWRTVLAVKSVLVESEKGSGVEVEEGSFSAIVETKTSTWLDCIIE